MPILSRSRLYTGGICRECGVGVPADARKIQKLYYQVGSTLTPHIGDENPPSVDNTTRAREDG